MNYTAIIGCKDPKCDSDGSTDFTYTHVLHHRRAYMYVLYIPYQIERSEGEFTKKLIIILSKNKNNNYSTHSEIIISI